VPLSAAGGDRQAADPDLDHDPVVLDGGLAGQRERSEAGVADRGDELVAGRPRDREQGRLDGSVAAAEINLQR